MFGVGVGDFYYSIGDLVGVELRRHGLLFTRGACRPFLPRYSWCSSLESKPPRLESAMLRLVRSILDAPDINNRRIRRPPKNRDPKDVLLPSGAKVMLTRLLGDVSVGTPIPHPPFGGTVTDLTGNWSTGFLDYIIPVNSWRFPEISVRAKQVSCRFSWKTVFSRLLP